MHLTSTYSAYPPFSPTSVRLTRRYSPAQTKESARERKTTMKALLNPEHSLSSISPIHVNRPRNFLRSQTSLPFFFEYGDGRIGRKPCLTLKAALDASIIDQLGLPESDIRNPAVSSSYRSSMFPKPNQTVLDAQARVCTGPTQTRPLGEDQAYKVLDTILRSGETLLSYVLIYACNLVLQIHCLEKTLFSEV